MPLELLTTELIDGGLLVGALDASIARIGEKVIACFGDHGDYKIAAGEVSVKIKISKDPKYDKYFRIEWDLQEKEPKLPAGNATFASSYRGKLVAQSTGTSQENPNQENFLKKLDSGGEKE